MGTTGILLERRDGHGSSLVDKQLSVERRLPVDTVEVLRISITSIQIHIQIRIQPTTFFCLSNPLLYSPMT
jgi:hypothetical protein